MNMKKHVANVTIKSPRQMVMERTQRLDDIARTLGIIINAKMMEARRNVEHSGQMLNSLGYKNVLARGYAIARGADNTIISRTTDAVKIASIEFADGIIKF
jgi:exodeoxyribonuclease VII large subunit